MPLVEAYLLFLIYVNDIYNSSDKLQFYLFADDMNLMYADKDLKILESILNAEQLKVYNWLTANKLSLNIKKTYFKRS
jgi:succinate dehydrogenase flavin-adding protein (antitoxin of CptAB toxin-antitoxin module)